MGSAPVRAPATTTAASGIRDGADVVRRSPRQRRSAEKVAAILDAARATLLDEPAADLTTRGLAERSGVAIPTLYRYFGDVGEILDVVLAEHAEAARAAVDEVLATAGPEVDPPDLFERVARAHLDLYRRRPELARAFADPDLAERHRQLEEVADRSLATDIGRHLVASGHVTRLTPTIEARLAAHWAAAGALLGAVLAAPSARARADLETELVDLVRWSGRRYA